LAEDLCARLEAGGVKRAELAREQGITRARVTQLLALSSLPSQVLAWIRDRGAYEPQVSERRLRPVLRLSTVQRVRAVATLFPAFGRSQRARA